MLPLPFYGAHCDSDKQLHPKGRCAVLFSNSINQDGIAMEIFSSMTKELLESCSYVVNFNFTKQESDFSTARSIQKIGFLLLRLLLGYLEYGRLIFRRYEGIGNLYVLVVRGTITLLHLTGYFTYFDVLYQ